MTRFCGLPISVAALPSGDVAALPTKNYGFTARERLRIHVFGYESVRFGGSAIGVAPPNHPR